ncbi:holo-ACP synthase [Corynebacterium sp. P5875]|uniref:Holo-[acyl-carrier-protein] synthase n=1 Tax=Corynebacterium antarcticum TaxID=2800405 RepID=A0A9Q4CC26_9CORY|nr:holo-ACP synthase [Corynebacterium antarcticum]MCX7537688.1 holo-ACP synthase [Corynebacterium antarcticum]
MPAIGTDLVHVPGFAEQLDTPGSTFTDVFTATEKRTAARKPAHLRAEHLAGRWAAKEAFIKAWSTALYGQPPVIAQERLDWREIEVRPDRWGRVTLVLHGEVASAVASTLGKIRVTLSISHDGDYATAVCHVNG